MISALVLVVLVSATEAHSASTSALEHAAEDALGAGAKVSIESVPAPPSASELARAAPEADLVASVDWLDDEHRRASLRCYIASEHRVVSRELSFDAQDRLSERGRLIGLSLAAMAPEHASAQPAQEEPPVQTPPERASKRAPTPTAAPPPPTAGQAARQAIGALDLVGVGAIGLGGPATGLGAGLSGRWFFARTLSIRAGVGFRRGQVEEADAGSQFAYGALGLGFVFAQVDRGKFSFGGRGDWLFGSFGMRRRSEVSGMPEHQERFLAGADLLLESCWYLGENAGIVFGLGGELAFGDTDVVVAHRDVADIPPLRALAELGARARF